MSAPLDPETAQAVRAWRDYDARRYRCWRPTVRCVICGAKLPLIMGAGRPRRTCDVDCARALSNATRRRKYGQKAPGRPLDARSGVWVGVERSDGR